VNLEPKEFFKLKKAKLVEVRLEAKPKESLKIKKGIILLSLD